jgi:glycosyltransferase involved in cell wall biosynthesis
MSKSVLMIAYTNYCTDPRVMREAEAALSAGFEVDFLALRREGDPAVEMVRGVRIIHLNQRRYRGGGLYSYTSSYFEFLLRSFCKAAALHLQKRYRIVHVNNMPDFMVFSALVPRLLGAKVLLDIHDPMPETFESKFKGAGRKWVHSLLLWQERISARFAHRVLTVHEPVKIHILVKHGLPPDSILVVANFADDTLFPLRENVPLDGQIRLVFHGTIIERSGLGQLLDALARLRHPDRVSAKIIGEGDFSQELARRIVALGLQDRVEFINRAIPVNEIPAAIADCNVGIVPLEISSITNYALPLKLLEYISLGMPVVSVRNVAISHYFTEADCLFYEPNSVASLQSALDRLAENPALLLRYRNSAVAARERFLWSREKRKYTDLLNELSA